MYICEKNKKNDRIKKLKAEIGHFAKELNLKNQKINEMQYEISLGFRSDIRSVENSGRLDVRSLENSRRLDTSSHDERITDYEKSLQVHT